MFAGGKGSRLSELTKTVPKPSVDVNGRPLITYLIDWAIEAGFERVVVCAGYMQTVMKRRLLDYYELGGDVVIGAGHTTHHTKLPPNFSIVIRDTGLEEETAERIYAVRDLLAGDDRFVCTYGDTLTNLDFNRLLETANGSSAGITMCVGRPDGRYGEIVMAGDKVLEFKEKKRPEFYVNRGFFVINTSIFDDWNASDRSFENDVLPRYAARGDLVAHKDECWFHSVDSIKDHEELEKTLSKVMEKS